MGKLSSETGRKKAGKVGKGAENEKKLVGQRARKDKEA